MAAGPRGPASARGEQIVKAALIALGAVASITCGGSHLGSRMIYEMSELPHPLVAGEAGSCMSRYAMYYSELQAMKWAVGAKLEVSVSWPDRQDCTGTVVARCPEVNVSLAPVNSTAWKTTLVATAATALVDVEAISSGEGGFRVGANGDQFDPPFVLVATTGALIWFERATSPAYADLIPGAISELRLAPGQDAIVAVTLRTTNGEHLCGPVPATVTTSGMAFSVSRLGTEDYVNLPYHIIAGSTPGQGTVQVASGGVTATLTVIVGP
jgi:hypothetical protein